jgi:hypothetical protein
VCAFQRKHFQHYQVDVVARGGHGHHHQHPATRDRAC